jgi:hypothetical protein
METCEHCQSQLLEYLYELIEGEERQALEAHLEQCAVCQAALVTARAQQQLLAAAAKPEFAGFRFEAPRTEAVARVTIPIPTRPVRRPLLRWAVAAVVLLAVAGLSIPGARYGSEYAQASRAFKEHQVVVAQIQYKAREQQEQLKQVPADERKELNDLNRKVNGMILTQMVIGPRSIQAGARNEYRIETRDLNGEHVPTRLEARVLDQNSGKIVFEQKDIDNKDGVHQLVLPPNLLLPKSKLALEVIAEKASGEKSKLREPLDLAAPLYVTHLATDKPMYQPGELVYFRSLTLDRFSLKPPEEELRIIYSMTRPGGQPEVIAYGSSQLRRDDGRLILGPDEKPLRGVGSGYYPLDGNAGGEFTLTVSEANNRFPPQQRKFLVNRYEKPRLNKKLDFAKKTYGAGEVVTAACEATRAEGGTSVARRPVLVTVKVDERTYGADGQPATQPIRFETDADGKVNIRFTLPKAIDKGDATVSVTFDDGANIDTIVRPIPLVLKKLDVEFYPEGGDLIAGLENRVYFQVRTPLGKPAEIKGRILDQDKKVVVDEVQTLNDADEPGVNQGQGRFAFTPKAGVKYQLKIDSPASVEGMIPLPQVREDGVVLSIPKGVTTIVEPIQVRVRSAKTDRSLLVGAYCRGRLLAYKRVSVEKGKTAPVELKPEPNVGGVYRVTVFEERAADGKRPDLVPVAERLVYRAPSKELLLTVKPDKKVYVPGDKVRLSVSALDEGEDAKPAVVMLAVVDKSVVTMADEKTARSMPTHFYLTTEVKKPEDLEYADFLVGSHPRAATALDLMLGTQGWRRFAEQNPGQFRQKHKEDAERLLATIGQERLLMAMDQSPVPVEFEERETNKIQIAARTREGQLRQELADTDRELADARKDPDYLAALGTLNRFDGWFVWGRTVGTPILVLALFLSVVLALFLAARRAGVWALPWYATSAVCGVLALVLFVDYIAYEPARNQAYNDAQNGAPTSDRQRTEFALGDRFQPQGRPKDMARPDDMDKGDKDKDKAKADKNMEDRDAPQFGFRGGAPGDDKAPAPAAGQVDELNKGKDLAVLEEQGKEGAKIRAAEKKGDGKGGEAKAQNQAGEARGGGFGKPGGVPPRVPQQDALAGNAVARPPFHFEGKAKQLREAEILKMRPDDFRKRLVPDRRLGADKERSLPMPASFVIREYAYSRAAGAKADRDDFRETVYWHPVLVLPNGKTEVQFDLSDSVTTFQVTAFAHSLDGRLGAATGFIEARQPLVLEPKLPIEVTASDKIDVPLAIANNTEAPRGVDVNAAFQGLSLLDGKLTDRIDLAADARVRRLYRLQPTLVEGVATVTFDGSAGPKLSDKDKIKKNIKVVPDGFPILGSHSDLLEKAAPHEIVLPKTWVKGTLKLQASVYPSTLADLQKGLDALLREPNGCFEQTSTSNYPNLLILDYLKNSDQTNPAVEKRARDLLARGYQKLTSFECPKSGQRERQGYEWFGSQDQAHEALTAYGLLQFRDMSRVQEVDKNMIERTRNYLMGQRDGKGGFKRNTRALDTFGRAPENITNAYIVWALTESGKDDDVTTELNALAAQAETSKDPYFLALVANSLINRAQTARATGLLKKLAGAQQADGHLDAAQTSITGSGGRDLQIETTGLSVLAWLKANPGQFNNNVREAIKWISKQRGGYGGFGSTQSTILALKALIEYTKANKKTPEAGTLKLFVDDREVRKLDFSADVRDALEINLPDAEKVLKPGKNQVRVEITGKNVFPYTLTWSYQTLTPASDPDCPVKLTTELDRANANEGETVTLKVAVQNPSKDERSMVVAIVGLPAGLTIPEDMKQLKDYMLPRDGGKKPGRISFFETRGRELILYWRGMGPKQRIEIPLELICRVPGEYRGPASRAYLFYNADHKHWVEPLEVTIKAKGE